MNNSIVQNIKDNLDIVDYIARFAPDLKKNGRYYKACCPFHSEKTPSFVVNPDTQSWRCFGACAEGGDLFAFAMKRHGWTFSEAIQELGQLAGVDTRVERSPQSREQDERVKRLHEILKTACEYYHRHLLSNAPDAQPILTYAQHKRGFTLETIQKFQIGYAPKGWDNMLTTLQEIGYPQQDILDAGLLSQNDKGRVYDRFRHRLMIPIQDERGNIVGFGARALDPEDNPKYLNSPQSLTFDKSKLLFGLNFAKNAIRTTDTAVIVEGYMDAIQAHQAGYANVVAQMGTAMTDTQLKLVVPRYAKRIILALDADSAGQNATRRSVEVARQALEQDYEGRINCEIRILHIDNAKDPDDVLRETPELWQGYVDQARPVADFVIDMETADLTPKATIQEKQAIANRLFPILMASENNVMQKNNLQKLALRLRIEEKDILVWSKAFALQAQKKAPAPVVQDTPPPKSYAPPLPSEVYSNAEEPPPLSHWDEPPPYDEDDFVLPSVQKPKAPAPQKSAASPQSDMLFTSRHVSRAAEAFCLRELIRDFDFYYQINRKFREVLATDAKFQDHNLTELNIDDFSQTDFRLVLSVLLEAHAQDDEEPQDYLRNHLDPNLMDLLNLMSLSDVETIFQRINNRMGADMSEIIKELERTPPTLNEVKTQMMRRVMDLREQRLQRELAELRFLLMDMGDLQTARSLYNLLQQTLMAIQYFHIAQQQTLSK